MLDNARLFDAVEAAIADCTLVFATTARAHDQAKPVIGPEAAVRVMAPRIAAGESVGVIFGRERYGLENTEVALTDAIVTFPVNPAFASLNLAQAALVIAYEWFKLVTGGALPFAMPQKSDPATKEQLLAFFENVERELDRVEFFRPAEKHETMMINLRNIFHRMQPTRQDIQTLSGVIMSIAEGRKGPARGGVLDGPEAEILRALIAEREPEKEAQSPARGLARLLRRNPTEAERKLWHALTNDRRFASHGFKRQTPVGRHVTDVVSFPLRLVIDLLPSDESAAAAKARVERRAWLEQRGYTVVVVQAAEVEADVGAVLERVMAVISKAE